MLKIHFAELIDLLFEFLFEPEIFDAPHGQVGYEVLPVIGDSYLL